MSKRLLVSTALCAGLCWAPAWAAGAALASAPVQSTAEQALQSFDGVVEAVRSSVVAAQVAGAIVALDVKAGDSVRAGQTLLRIDARAAEQNASASQAQVQSAQALLDVARKDYERQKQLFDKQYISQAALERAESQFKASQAQAAALLAQAGAARTQSGLHVLRAPFAGVVAEVPVALGDMALPGKPLLTLYQPGALRVTADAWLAPAMPDALARRLARSALHRMGAARDVSRAHLDRIVRFWRSGRRGRAIELPGDLVLSRDARGFRLARRLPSRSGC